MLILWSRDRTLSTLNIEHLREIVAIRDRERWRDRERETRVMVCILLHVNMNIIALTGN